MEAVGGSSISLVRARDVSQRPRGHPASSIAAPSSVTSVPTFSRVPAAVVAAEDALNRARRSFRIYGAVDVNGNASSASRGESGGGSGSRALPARLAAGAAYRSKRIQVRQFREF